MQNRNPRTNRPFVAMQDRPQNQGLSPTRKAKLNRLTPPKVIVDNAKRCRWLVRFQHTPEAMRLLTGPQLQLGTNADNNIVLRGRHIAPLHCTVRREGSLIRLYDHGSLLGTLANGRPVYEPTILHATTRLLLGHQEITIRALDPPPTTDSLRGGFLPPASSRRDPSDEAQGAPSSQHGQGTRKYPGRRWQLLAFFAVLVGTAGITRTLLTSARTESHHSASKQQPTRPLSNHSLSHSVADSPIPHALPVSHSLRALSSRSTPAKAAPPSLQTTPVRSANAQSVLSGDPLGPSHDSQSSNAYTRGHRVERGETWASIADNQGIARAHLRAANSGLRRPLRAGDRLRVPGRPRESIPSPAVRHGCGDALEIPGGARSVGNVTLGSLDNPIRMPKLDLYQLRCPRHSYTTAATARSLIDAIACFRENHRYSGEIIIGDISRECGGSLGPHRSHQSGRDVDLWLPVAGGRYGRGCDHCGTDYCRPEPDEIDWDATWVLVQALAARPEVEVVFLDFDLQAKLRRSALNIGADPATLDAVIQWPRRGAPTLVQHSAGHVHHMHIRFRCPPGDQDCDARPPSASATRTKFDAARRPRELPLFSSTAR
ncbi:MAG TPA: FHA domain-containing protein [Nannocystis exedens]|nr:FHA domain-containing protein [Nannocystis exedens]